MDKLWKFLDLKDGKIVSHYDQSEWKIGEWRTEKPPTELCKGLNASKQPLDALCYVKGEVLASVEVKGEIIRDVDKWTCEQMRIVKAWKWTKKDSVALSIFSAELCIGIYEKQYPNDDRPRKAIEAAKKWLKNPTKENESAAESAAWSAAWSAARSAAESAAWSAAWSAARSAESAARSAAWSAAWSAARSAESAARSAESAALKKINSWIISHTKEMEQIDG